jgi:ribosomal protein L30E
MKDYIRNLSDFMQTVRRTGSAEYGLREVKKHTGAIKLLIASNDLSPEEEADLEDIVKNTRGALIHLRDVTPAELGRAVGRPHPVRALAVTSLGDADLDKFLESVKDLEESGILSVTRAARRR